MATEVHIMSVAEYFLIAEMTPSGMPMSAVRITLHMASSIVTGSRFSIAVQSVPDVSHILHQQRVVKAQLFVQGLNGLGRSVDAEEQGSRVAGREAHNEHDEQNDAKQYWDQKQ